MDSDKLPLNPSPVGLAELVREAVNRLAAICRVRQVEITTDLADNPEVVVDEDLVERIASESFVQRAQVLLARGRGRRQSRTLRSFLKTAKR